MKSESISHILAYCSAYNNIRKRIFEEYAYLCLQSCSGIDFNELLSDNEKLCQFILDPTSLNLEKRVNPSDPMLGNFIEKSRDLCYAISELRIKLLGRIEEVSKPEV